MSPNFKGLPTAVLKAVQQAYIVYSLVSPLHVYEQKLRSGLLLILNTTLASVRKNN